MTYRVFVSHNSLDREWVDLIRQELIAVGVEPYLFEHDQRPGSDVADKIQSAIRASNVMVVLMTQNSGTSSYVHQEIGYALRDGKLVVPLVERGAPKESLAMLGKLEYISFDFAAPQAGLRDLSAFLAKKKKAREEEELVIALLIIGALFVIALNSTSNA